MTEPLHPDTVRLNWLEHMARNGGIFLYNGVDVTAERRTAVGLGLRPGRADRTLREAIDAAFAGRTGSTISESKDG
jgi:hypothetical protein